MLVPMFAFLLYILVFFGLVLFFFHNEWKFLLFHMFYCYLFFSFFRQSLCFVVSFPFVIHALRDNRQLISLMLFFWFQLIQLWALRYISFFYGSEIYFIWNTSLFSLCLRKIDYLLRSFSRVYCVTCTLINGEWV